MGKYRIREQYVLCLLHPSHVRTHSFTLSHSCWLPTHTIPGIPRWRFRTVVVFNSIHPISSWPYLSNSFTPFSFALCTPFHRHRFPFSTEISSPSPSQVSSFFLVARGLTRIHFLIVIASIWSRNFSSKNPNCLTLLRPHAVNRVIPDCQRALDDYDDTVTVSLSLNFFSWTFPSFCSFTRFKSLLQYYQNAFYQVVWIGWNWVSWSRTWRGEISDSDSDFDEWCYGVMVGVADNSDIVVQIGVWDWTLCNILGPFLASVLTLASQFLDWRDGLGSLGLGLGLGLRNWKSGNLFWYGVSGGWYESRSIMVEDVLYEGWLQDGLGYAAIASGTRSCQDTVLRHCDMGIRQGCWRRR